ncbi:hypothetical protein [Candidatus Electronema sp. JC]|uniref:hypothetical protein n=1 Tax=Candidatus Electronema sp. JC TaxID=3401570 RepID=UPI003B4293B3
MDWMEQIKAVFSWLPTNPDIIWDGWGLAVVSACFAVVGFVSSKLYACLRGASQASNTLTIEKHTEIVLDLDRKYQQQLYSIEEIRQKEQKQNKEQEEALANLQGQLPEVQIEKAQVDLRQGNKQAAKQAFSEVRQQTGKITALAAYYGGQIAEEELDYTEAMSLYRDAVTLKPNNPDYLLAAGLMARIMGDYQQAEEWLKHRLVILEQ